MGRKIPLRVAFQNGLVENKFDKAMEKCPEEFKATFTDLVDEMAFNSHRLFQESSDTRTRLKKEELFREMLEEHVKTKLYRDYLDMMQEMY